MSGKKIKNSVVALILLIIMAVFGISGSESTPDKENGYASEVQNAGEDVQSSEKQAQSSTEHEKSSAGEVQSDAVSVERDGIYTSKDEVAAYLHAFGELPSNYITKKEARNLGWDSSEGNLWDVTDQKSIGGDHFGNYDKILPEKKGRKYYECDIDYDGGYRGPCRLVYSNDGLIYYTEDHYNTFEQLY